MKRSSPAFTAVRQAIDASNADSARQGAVVLKQAFAEVDAFLTRQARADAVSWAQTARLQAEAADLDPQIAHQVVISVARAGDERGRDLGGVHDRAVDAQPHVAA